MSSIRSRQTGQVGSSTSEGVGGGKGLRKVDDAGEGVKGSWESSGKEALVRELVCVGVWKVIDFMNTTWQASGCEMRVSSELK